MAVHYPAHLTTNEDIPELDTTNRERDKLQLDAAIIFKQGSGVEDRGDVLYPNIVERETRTDKTPDQFASEMATYHAKLEKTAHARATRTAEISEFTKSMEETRLASVQTVDYLTACVRLALGAVIYCRRLGVR